MELLQQIVEFIFMLVICTFCGKDTTDKRVLSFEREQLLSPIFC